MIDKLFKNTALLSLLAIFSFVFSLATKPTKNKLKLYACAIIALNSCRSVYYMFEHFIKKYATFKKSALYETLKHGKMELDWFSKAIIKLAVQVAENGKFALRAIIDDTLVEKFGVKFELIKNLFDHAKHNGTNYLTGHCFVCLALLIPVKLKDKTIYIRVPITFRLWRHNTKKTKIIIAKELFEQLIEEVGQDHTISLMFDSWYANTKILSILNKYKNVEAQFSAKINTCMYNTPPKYKGRGRPCKLGSKISPDDFELKDIPGTNYSAGSRSVITRIAGTSRVVTATVTYNKDAKTKRLFICTNPGKCYIEPEMISNKLAKAMAKDKKLNACAGNFLRWGIETTFQETKAFWGVEDYMLRSATGIERLLNIELTVYAVLSLLPWLVKDFAYLADCSIQERRFEVGKLIDRELFLGSLGQRLESEKKYALARELERLTQDKPNFWRTGS